MPPQERRLYEEGFWELYKLFRGREMARWRLQEL